METRARLRIGELARRVGVTTDLIRAWENRYAVASPERSAGGYRLYSERDEARLKRIREHLAEGLSTAEAAAQALAEIPLDEPPDRAGTAGVDLDDLDGVADELLGLLTVFDEASAQALLDRVLGGDLDRAIREVLLPCLRELGRRWEKGEITVGQEHFASNVIEGRLLTLARGWHRGLGPPVLLACPAGEQHVIGLICFGLALNSRGWRVTFLGSNTPVASAWRTADILRPALVVLSGSQPRSFLDEEETVREIAAHHRVAIAGAGATPSVAEQLGLERLDGDP